MITNVYLSLYMLKRLGSALMTAVIVSSIPATALAHNTAYKGLGTFFAILGGLVILAIITLILCIINITKKNRILRIICAVFTIPIFAISLFISIYGYSVVPVLVSFVMVFMIYKSIPQKPLPPAASSTDNEITE